MTNSVKSAVLAIVTVAIGAVVLLRRSRPARSAAPAPLPAPTPTPEPPPVDLAAEARRCMEAAKTAAELHHVSRAALADSTDLLNKAVLQLQRSNSAYKRGDWALGERNWKEYTALRNASQRCWEAYIDCAAAADAARAKEKAAAIDAARAA